MRLISDVEPNNYSAKYSVTYSAPVSHELTRGWNAISMPYSEYDVASDVIAADINFTAIYHYTSLGWEGYWRDGSGVDFDLQYNNGEVPFDPHANAQGLFLYCDCASGTKVYWP